MKKILRSGKPDDTLAALEKRLSGHYTVRSVSTVPIALFGIIVSFKPDAVVLKTIDTDNSVFAYLKEKLPDVKVFAVGSPDGTGGIPDFHAYAVCPRDADAVCEAIYAAVPFSPEDTTNGKPVVMVVDDDAAMLRMVKAMIDKDCFVIPALSGEKALKLLEHKKPDVILLDYEMPVLNGAGTLERLRTDSRFADIPVIFLTGVSDAGTSEEIRRLGVQGYLVKPADASDIKAAVEKAILSATKEKLQ